MSLTTPDTSSGVLWLRQLVYGDQDPLMQRRSASSAQVSQGQEVASPFSTAFGHYAGVETDATRPVQAQVASKDNSLAQRQDSAAQSAETLATGSSASSPTKRTTISPDALAFAESVWQYKNTSPPAGFAGPLLVAYAGDFSVVDPSQSALGADPVAALTEVLKADNIDPSQFEFRYGEGRVHHSWGSDSFFNLQIRKNGQLVADFDAFQVLRSPESAAVALMRSVWEMGLDGGQGFAYGSTEMQAG